VNAMKVYRLADGPRKARRYLDSRRVSRLVWDAAHFGCASDSYASRMETRRDGSVIVREYHCIRVRVGG